MAPRRGVADESGETLVEMLLAVAIMGLAVVGLMAGLTTSVLMSDIHRKQTTAGAYLHDFAEAVEESVASGHYLGCANAANYRDVAVANFPAGTYTKSVVGSSCAFGTDVQQLTLQVRSNDGRASERLVVFVRKPCTAAPC